MRILLLDNIDSFTFLILHYLEQCEVEVNVIDNRRIDLKEISHYDGIVLSPGPGLPKDAGQLMSVISKAIELNKPILGICLGMQAIAEHFGGELYNMNAVKHGYQSTLTHTENSHLFNSIPESLQIGRYHSWAVKTPLPSSLIATSYSEDGVLMSLENSDKNIYAVQFHPESILSQYGLQLFQNFVDLVKK